MALVPMKEILDAAERGNYGVPALNINEMLQLQAYLNAAFERKSPVILQASMGSRKFTGWLSKEAENPDLGAAVTIGMIKTFIEQYRAVYGYDVPVSITLDHGPDFKQCKGAIDNGFPSVMIDASLDYGRKDDKGKHPARTLDENIKVTREVVEYAHKRGVSVEGELGTLGGVEDETQAASVHLTDPDEVERFVKETGVDALAVAIGTSHGAYKFPGAAKLALDLVPKIHAKAGTCRLVMHGSSSVPANLVALVDRYPVVCLDNGVLGVTGFFNPEAKKPETRRYTTTNPWDMARLGSDLAFFSCLKKSSGVPMEAIREAIKGGVRKINVDTDGRLGTTGAIRKFMAEKPDEFDQRKYFEAARKALYEMAVEKMVGFGSAGKV
ncbi:MAG: Fructose-bisphosphate aldolase [Lentisphaerae bacterium ADurb.BinA184]|nr:MAG: Fructose-bisphosphate aldolase [Lentisphaerae bacterium ADurb.BinA184]